AAVGLPRARHRPALDIRSEGFIAPAADQPTTQLARLHSRTAGTPTAPVVIPAPYGGGIGAIEHHSESPEALFAHTAGLRVVTPSNPADAYVMIQQAIASPDPVLFFEPKARYWDRGEVPTGASDADLGISERVTTPAGTAQLKSARILRAGTDLTIAAYGPTARTGLMVADVAADAGTDTEMINLRSLSTIDFETVTASVRKMGRLVGALQSPVFFGAGAEIAARVSQECFYHLEAPVARVGGFHTPYPVSKVEEEYLPGLDRVLHAVEESMAY